MTVHELETPSTSLALDHECAYKDRIEWYLRNMGSRGLASASSLQRQVEGLHVDGVCPPTHVGTGPTKEWEEIIESTHI